MQDIVLEDNIGRLFVKQRHGIKTHALLKKVRREKVTLECPDKHNQYTISLSEFLKFFRKVESRVTTVD